MATVALMCQPWPARLPQATLSSVDVKEPVLLDAVIFSQRQWIARPLAQPGDGAVAHKPIRRLVVAFDTAIGVAAICKQGTRVQNRRSFYSWYGLVDKGRAAEVSQGSSSGSSWMLQRQCRRVSNRGQTDPWGP